MSNYTENSALYDQLISTNPTIERKGKTMPYTSLNGHMVSFLSKEGAMGLRLSKTDRELFIEEYNSALMEQHGRIMKEFVAIPNDLLQQTNVLATYLQKSIDYTSTLKPKPSSKK